MGKTAWRFCALPLVFLCWWLAFGQSDSQSAPVSIIVVGSEADAARIVSQLKGGADFAALARSNSTDPTANDGGYMGTIDPSKLRAELAKALVGVARGGITGIVKIPSGYAVLKVLDSAPLAS